MSRESRPRQRTIREMQRLLAMATGAALGACTKGQDGCSNNVAALLGKLTGSEATGYAVVDPMPPPARCTGFAATIEAKTRWEEDMLAVELSAPGLPGTTYDASKRAGAAYTISTTNSETTQGVILKDQNVTAKTVALRLEVPSNTKQISVQVAILCPEGPERLLVVIRPASGASLEAGGRVLAELSDLR